MLFGDRLDVRSEAVIGREDELVKGYTTGLARSTRESCSRVATSRGIDEPVQGGIPSGANA